ncbi:type IV toxin-antitoxin system AbiEi family antitoxin domain-containing protein [Serinicoccus chungangensis]|uniref:type IV toxin-antitoxin system AbiEi family antitoxin domain-containing protein n=1 Tax=Serinicoccus chungangensis TaxID=767452 RepID=UPI00111A0192|nr:type IV toxin-antitoxin system AbiEi family antitoxin domain-containing protein [Serinicoccus chungangensis]
MEHVQARLSAQHHVASGDDLRALGLSRTQVRRLITDGVLVRIRKDCFVSGEVWRGAAPWQRHDLRARAVATKLCGPGRPYVLSHHSGLGVRRIGTYGVDDKVHLTRTDGQRGRSDGVVHVHPPVSPRWVIVPEDPASREPPVVDPALACLQVAGSMGLVAGLVSADIALREKATTIEQLQQAGREGSFGHGAPAVRTVVEHATGLSGSAGETRARWIMLEAGLPVPELQATICDEYGELVGFVDFLLREAWTVVEFDGALKYGSSLDLMAEKWREDRLRALGYEVVRITWGELDHPERVVAKVRAAMARGVARHAFPA